MSPPEVWGPAVWTLFHTLAEKINEKAFPFIKGQLFGQIKRICLYLPCPECSTDATNFLARININNINSKVEFINTFYLFHNYVNAKKRKPLYNYSSLSKYNNYKLVSVLNNFISNYNTKGNMKLLAESFQRKLILSDFKSWITKYIRAFVTLQTTPKPISDKIIDENTVVITEDKPVFTEEALVSVKEEVQIITEETPIIKEETLVTEEAVVSVKEEDQIVTEEPQIITEEPQIITEEPQIITKEPQIITEEVQLVTEQAIGNVKDE